MIALYLAIAAVLGYFFGSINFAVIFARKFGQVDVRDVGSGNAGATNAMRVSKKAGILTFVFDALKGFFAAGSGLLVMNLLANGAFNNLGAIIGGLFCMIGHCWPVFFEFRGGKGVATCVGIFAICCPVAIIIGLAVFAIILAISKMVSLGSLLATTTVVAITLYWVWTHLLASISLIEPITISVIVFSMGTIIFIKHKENIKRLIKGEERRFTLKKEK